RVSCEGRTRARRASDGLRPPPRSRTPGCRRLRRSDPGVWPHSLLGVQVQLNRRGSMGYKSFEVELSHIWKPGEVSSDCHADQLSHSEAESSSSTGNQRIDVRIDIRTDECARQLLASAFASQ